MDMTLAVSLLNQLGINSSEITPDARLNDDLAIDSQEMVELECLIEMKINTKLKEHMPRNMTVSELQQYLLQLIDQVTSIPEDKYEVVITNQIVIKQPLSMIMGKLWNLRDWTTFLPHVTDISVLYEDKKVQEFLMCVTSGSGEIKVRSFRSLRSENVIDFYQPEPPALLNHHAGTWSFEQSDKGSTLIVLTHKCNPDYEKAAVHYGTVVQEEIIGRIEEWLSEHGTTTLNAWKKVLEPENVLMK